MMNTRMLHALNNNITLLTDSAVFCSIMPALSNGIDLPVYNVFHIEIYFISSNTSHNLLLTAMQPDKKSNNNLCSVCFEKYVNLPTVGFSPHAQVLQNKQYECFSQG